jgi:hypothetical protein
VAVAWVAVREARAPVHTQPFAFRAPEEDDESVKMSHTTNRRSSAVTPTLRAARPPAKTPAKHQLLFSTNEGFSPVMDFVTTRKQSTSLFLFSTNERSRNTHAAAIYKGFHVRPGRDSMAAQHFSTKFNLSRKRKA